MSTNTPTITLSSPTTPGNGNAITSRGYLNVILTANVAVLALIAITGLAPGRGLLNEAGAQVTAAAGQPDGDDPTGRVSAAEQRKQIIAEIKAVGSRVERMEHILAKGLNVKVTELPASFMKAVSDNGKDGAKAGDAKK